MIISIILINFCTLRASSKNNLTQVLKILVLNFIHIKTFRKLDSFPSSGKGGKTSTLLCPLEGANLNHRTTYVSLTTAIQIPETRLWHWEETGNMYKKSPRTHKFRISYTIVTTLQTLYEITALLLS
jgi:hypothetical protein